MHTLTVWQPWASLIVAGVKPHEFRRWPAPRRFVGRRIVIHAAARRPPPAELAALAADVAGHLARTCAGGGDRTRGRELLARVCRDPAALPLAAGLGTAVLGEPQRALDLFAGSYDPDEIDPDVWAWPLADVRAWPEPIPAKGAQGFWRWDPPTDDPHRPAPHRRTEFAFSFSRKPRI